MNPNEMYKEIILDYYRNPRNYGRLTSSDIEEYDINPLCGDELSIAIKLDGNRIEDIKFNGKGCVISQVSASMLTEMVLHKSLKDVIKLNKKSILDSLGIELSPARLKCALLSLKVLKTGVYKYLGKRFNGNLDD